MQVAKTISNAAERSIHQCGHVCRHSVKVWDAVVHDADFGVALARFRVGCWMCTAMDVCPPFNLQLPCSDHWVVVDVGGCLVACCVHASVLPMFVWLCESSGYAMCYIDCALKAARVNPS